MSTTNFPNNIYGGDVVTVRPRAYFKRDVEDCRMLNNLSGHAPNPYQTTVWSWNMFNNGYGHGNFHGQFNDTMEYAQGRMERNKLYSPFSYYDAKGKPMYGARPTQYT